MIRQLAVFFVACLSSFAADLVITGAKVFASPDAAPLSNATVVISNGIITAVEGKDFAPASMPRLRCSGCFIFAGFWNSHVHFTEPEWAAAATAH
jgi:dihydroorotase-like cyclic amidohydrolase